MAPICAAKWIGKSASRAFNGRSVHSSHGRHWGSARQVHLIRDRGQELLRHCQSPAVQEMGQRQSGGLQTPGATALETFTLPTRSMAGRERSWTFRSARGGSPSHRRPSSFHSRCPTSISTPSPHTTCCVRGVCRSESAITKVGCAPGWPRPPDVALRGARNSHLPLTFVAALPAGIRKRPPLVHDAVQRSYERPSIHRFGF